MNVAFVGLAFHFQTTKSTQFFLQILRSEWPEAQTWTPEEIWLNVGLRKVWDLAVFLQYIPPLAEIRAIGARRTVLIPMFDASPTEPSFWEPYLGVPILAFSTTQGERLRAWGHDVRTVSYATPLPKLTCDWSPGLRGFFWPRTPQLTWEHIKPLIPDGMRVHIHFTDSVHSDPRIQLPSQEEMERYQVTTSRWFESPSDLERTLRSCNVYFAPRPTEGIGMSFLEATGLGMAVVACDQPTMNEAIRHGVDGWLYDPGHPEAPDWSRAEEWGRAARTRHEERRRGWEASIPGTVDFLRPREGSRRSRPFFRRLGRIGFAFGRLWLRAGFRVLKAWLRPFLAQGRSK